MFLLVPEDLDAGVLRDVIDAVAEIDDLLVLLAGGILGVDHAVDDADHVALVFARL